MWSLKCDFLKSGGKTLEKHKKVTESGGKTSAFGQDFGRSGEAQTRGLRIPNAARYQLRYTPIVIKLWSCRWSNLWSNTVLTAFFHLPNRPKSARLKGFRRLSLSYSANTVYAPKAGALPTALYPDIRFFCMIPCGEGKSKFFVSVGSAVVKPGFAGGSSGGGFPPQATVPRTSRLSLFGEWIGSLSSQITRAANYATFGHRYFSRPGAFFPTYVRQYTLRSAALALWHHLLLDRGQHDGFILYLSILPVSPPKSSLFASGRYVGKAVRRLWGLRTA